MRGAHPAGNSGFNMGGFIPAYAGSTFLLSFFFMFFWVHPRVCGEHMRCSRTSVSMSGSSPRMRGAPLRARAEEVVRGIIPAYAGSTSTSTARRSCARDHPRVCGEHSGSFATSSMTVGSSPRMRGALPLLIAHVTELGIIPAYAGSTRRAISNTRSPRDHPRVCGEHCNPSPLA